MFNTPTTKPYLFGYNLLLVLIGILLLLAKLQVVWKWKYIKFKEYLAKLEILFYKTTKCETFGACCAITW